MWALGTPAYLRRPAAPRASVASGSTTGGGDGGGGPATSPPSWLSSTPVRLFRLLPGASLVLKLTEDDPDDDVVFACEGPPPVASTTWIALAKLLMAFTLVGGLLPELYALLSLLGQAAGAARPAPTIQAVGNRLLGAALLPSASVLYVLAMATRHAEQLQQQTGGGGAAASPAGEGAPGVTLAMYKRLSFAVVASAVSMVVSANDILELFWFGDGLRFLSWGLQLVVAGMATAVAFNAGKAWYVGHERRRLGTAIRSAAFSLFKLRAANGPAMLYSALTLAWLMPLLTPALMFDFTAAVKGSTILEQVIAGATSQSLGTLSLVVAFTAVSLRWVEKGRCHRNNLMRQWRQGVL